MLESFIVDLKHSIEVIKFKTVQISQLNVCFNRRSMLFIQNFWCIIGLHETLWSLKLSLWKLITAFKDFVAVLNFCQFVVIIKWIYYYLRHLKEMIVCSFFHVTCEYCFFLE